MFFKYPYQSKSKAFEIVRWKKCVQNAISCDIFLGKNTFRWWRGQNKRRKYSEDINHNKELMFVRKPVGTYVLSNFLDLEEVNGRRLYKTAFFVDTSQREIL